MKIELKKAYNPSVFYPSVVVICLILAVCFIFPDISLSSLTYTQKYLTANFGWFYVLTASIIFFTCVFLLFSKYGEIKLGPDHSTPDFKNLSWYSMLFAAGMGIGLMFFGVGEPLMHYLLPPSAEPNTIEAAKEAMKLTFFHWGFNAWAIYAIVSVILAYFAYRHNLPLTLKSAFYPIVGDKIYGKFGDMIDVFAVIATIFGVTTSLGFGVLQIGSGFEYLFGIKPTIFTQISIVFFIMLLVTISATSGVNKGIKFLSNLNLILAVILVTFILILGNTTNIMKALIENIGGYLTSFVGDNFNLFAYEKQKEDWLGGWTILYWTWWLSWSPFVGLFIAKISRGRTIREFIIGVLFIPSGFIFIWMTVFGNSAIALVNSGFIDLANIVNKDVSLALFIFLEEFPFTTIMCVISVFMIVIFFITSADSSALVVDMLCSNGNDRTPIWQKIFWCTLIGLITIVLLYAGGLSILQAMTMISAMPFAIALLGSIRGLFKALKVDHEKRYTRSVFNLPTTMGSPKSWQERLKAIINTPNKDDAKEFIVEIAEPVFREVAKEFENNKFQVYISKNPLNNKMSIEVDLGVESNFIYGVKIIETITPDYALSDSYYRVEVFLSEGGQDYDVSGWSKEALINDIVEQYRKHMYFLHKTR